jgi:hypothetical protein
MNREGEVKGGALSLVSLPSSLHNTGSLGGPLGDGTELMLGTRVALVCLYKSSRSRHGTELMLGTAVALYNTGSPGGPLGDGTELMLGTASNL